MSRFQPIALCLSLLAATVALAAPEEKNPVQDEAIVAIQKMNGYVVQDNRRPGKPVTEVHLFEGKTAGIGLGLLEKCPRSLGSACTTATSPKRNWIT